MTDEIIIVKSNLHESNITNTNMTSFVSTSPLSLVPQQPRPLSTDQPPPINKNINSLVEHETHVDVDENIIIKTQNNISNKDDVEVAISNCNNCNNLSQKLLIDSSHQLLPSQQQQQRQLQQQQQLARSNLVNLNAYQSVSNNCIKQDLSRVCAINTDKLAENQLFPYEKCLFAATTRYKCYNYSKKVERTGCKKLISLSKKSKSDTCLNQKGFSEGTLTASHDCWNNFTSNDHVSGEFCFATFVISRKVRDKY